MDRIIEMYEGMKTLEQDPDDIAAGKVFPAGLEYKLEDKTCPVCKSPQQGLGKTNSSVWVRTGPYSWHCKGCGSSGSISIEYDEVYHVDKDVHLILKGAD